MLNLHNTVDSAQGQMIEIHTAGLWAAAFSRSP